MEPEANEGFHKRVLKYFWARTWNDGVTCETQFDVVTGEERAWEPLPPVPLSRVMWCPFTEELAEKVTARGQPAVAMEIPPITLDLDPNKIWKELEIPRSMFWGVNSPYEANTIKGERPIFKFQGAMNLSDYYLCSRCGTAFIWEGDGPLVCPNPECQARNLWFCSRCKQIKTDQIFLPNGEVRCPDCEKTGDPHGLLKIKNLVLMSYTWLETRYVIGIEGKFAVEFGEQEIRVLH